MLSKLINLVKRFQYELFLGSCVMLIAIVSYNLGQINSLKKTPITIRESGKWKVESGGQKAEIFNAINNTPHSTFNSPKADTRVVVSKNSNKYHYTHCSGAKRIKSKNQIWFNSATEAEKAGYTLAGNCQQ